MPVDLYEVFIRWCATPEKERTPQDLETFCSYYKVDNKKIVEFLDKPTYSDDLLRAAINFGISKLPDMIHVTYDHYMSNKNPNTLKAYMDALKFYDKKEGGNINVFNLNLSDEKYRNIIEREAKSIEVGLKRLDTKS